VRAAGSGIRSLSEVIGHTNVAFTIQQYVHSEMKSKLAGMQAIEQSVKKA